MKVALLGVVPADDQHVIADAQAEIDRLRARNAALVETLKAAPCPVDDRYQIGHCQQCGCAAGILIGDEQPASEVDRGNQLLREQRGMSQEPSEVTVRKQRDEWERS